MSSDAEFQGFDFHAEINEPGNNALSKRTLFRENWGLVDRLLHVVTDTEAGFISYPVPAIVTFPSVQMASWTAVVPVVPSMAATPLGQCRQDSGSLLSFRK